MYAELLLRRTRDAGAGAFGELPGGAASEGGALASAAGGGSCAACRRYGGAGDDANEEVEHDPVDDAQYEQEEPVGRAEAVHHQVDYAGQQDVDQRGGNEDEPGELHQLVGAQAWQGAAYPDEDEAHTVDLRDEVGDAEQVAK